MTKKAHGHTGFYLIAPPRGLDGVDFLAFTPGPPSSIGRGVGGYQICHKWLKDRKDRTLSFEELHHYQKVVVALAKTIRLMGD